MSPHTTATSTSSSISSSSTTTTTTIATTSTTTITTTPTDPTIRQVKAGYFDVLSTERHDCVRVQASHDLGFDVYTKALQDAEEDEKNRMRRKKVTVADKLEVAFDSLRSVVEHRVAERGRDVSSSRPHRVVGSPAPAEPKAFPEHLYVVLSADESEDKHSTDEEQLDKSELEIDASIGAALRAAPMAGSGDQPDNPPGPPEEIS